MTRTSSDHTQPTAPPRKRRIHRWIIRCVVGVPLLLALLVVLLMRSPLVGSVVGSTVFKLTGGQWHARRAIIAPNGQLIIDELSLRAPGISGDAGEVLSAPQAVADIDWSGLPIVRWFFASTAPGRAGSSQAGSRGVRITAIRLTKPVFRLSQCVEDDALNIGAFTPPPSTGQVGVDVPGIDVIDGRLEFTEHSARTGGYTVLNTMPVSGSFMPKTVAPVPRPVYSLRLQETGHATGVLADATERRGMILDGDIDLATDDISFKLYNFSLDAWPADSVPRFMRDIWRRLNMQGRISQAGFRYTRDTGIDASITVENISMAALVPARRADQPDAQLTLSKVNGEITISASGLHADLAGLVEDQTSPSRVQLDTYGTDLNCSLRCVITGEHINISRDPAFLPYVPPTVRQYLNWFGGPTADVDASVVIVRGDPVDGQPGPFRVPEGSLRFRSGAAAFHKFPYPFHNMSGEVAFDDNAVHIRRIMGDGPTGARLSASGLISPLGDDAEVALVIGVKGAPVDEHMLDAMQPGYRRMLEVLFSRPDYQKLLERRLVRPPTAEVEVAAEDAPPVFEFGGKADVGIKVGCPRGRNTPWYTEIDVDFAHAGLLPEPFPYPINASNVHLHINNTEALFTTGEFLGLRGGRAELTARVGFGDKASDPMTPEIRITALDMPVDELMLNAVPGDEPSSDATRPSASRILRNLDLRGALDARVAVSNAEPGSIEPAPQDFVGPMPLRDVDWSVVVELDKLQAAPKAAGAQASGDGRLCLRGLSGSVQISPSHVRVNSMVGQIGRISSTQPAAELSSATPAGELRLSLDADPRPRQPLPGQPVQPNLVAGITVEGLELSDPVEQAIEIFDKGAADDIAALRAKRDPVGRVNAKIDFSEWPDGATTVGLDVRSLEDVAVSGLGGRLQAHNLQGAVSLDARAGSPRSVRFHEFGADMRMDDDPAGKLTLNGDLPPDSPAPGGSPTLRCTLRDGRFESRLVQALASNFAGEATASDLATFGLKGSFDATVNLAGGNKPGSFSAEGGIEPRSLGFNLRGEPYTLAAIAGRLTFRSDPEGRVAGNLEGVELGGDQWRLSGAGAWTFDRIDGLGLTADFTGNAAGPTESLTRLLPSSARDAVKSLGLSVHSALLESARLELHDPPSGETRTGFSARLAFDDARADFGMKLEKSAGTASLTVRPAAPAGNADPVTSEVTLDLKTAVLDGISIKDTHADLRWLASGKMVADGMTASSHGGKITADVQTEPIAPVNPGDPARRLVNVDVDMFGLEFGPLRAEMSAASLMASKVEQGPPPSISDQPPAPGIPSASDTSRGILDARVSLSLVSGDINSRRGHGSLRVSEGDVLHMPILLPLVRMSNLMLPFGGNMNTLQSSFTITGPVATFDDITLSSGSVAIAGAGTITWPNLDLDMRFNSRSTKRIPLWSDVFETVRNELVTTTISGTLSSPVVRSEPFTGTRRMIDDVVNPKPPQSASPPPARGDTPARGVETATPQFSPADPEGK